MPALIVTDSKDDWSDDSAFVGGPLGVSINGRGEHRPIGCGTLHGFAAPGSGVGDGHGGDGEGHGSGSSYEPEENPLCLL